MIFVNYLPTIHGETSHHEAWISLFSAHVDSSSEPPLVWVPSLDNVCFVNKHVSVQISCVNPVTWEILRQTTSGLHHFCFHYKQN